VPYFAIKPAVVIGFNKVVFDGNSLVVVFAFMNQAQALTRLTLA
jgi:hypothetical protein